ncbi:MAG: hypothetical protein A2X86_22165 [Bdellovibrionales bacterium GWA2_49_15]|nr:MAG: hypothetical protein A2X86_22165 [Bdellovibrionales bacterium GWA2_49_15]HAZ14816.1 hypothetical protein [Bdellovibrionales bacterium]
MGDDYFKIASVEVEKDVAAYEVADQYLAPTGAGDKNLGEVIMVVDQLIALGKKIWPIIEAGRPVVNTNLPVVHVLPREAGQDGSLYDLSNWDAPKAIGYRVTYKNFYGMEVIAFTYSISFQPGGQFNGKGAYISGASVTANNVKVSWGFDFSAKSEVVAITNRGSRENPVAGLTLKISYIAKSVLSDIRNSYNYHLTGRGAINQVE